MSKNMFNGGMIGFRPQITPKKLLKLVAKGKPVQLLDLRDAGAETLPGALALNADPEVFYEEAAWIQARLGIRLAPDILTLIICPVGNQGQEACSHFYRKNRWSGVRLRNLKGGFQAYVHFARKRLQHYRKDDGAPLTAEHQCYLLDQLTDPATSGARFRYIAQRLMK